MEIEGVENLLDYVFTPGEGDFSLSPSMQEYKKLQRIMKVMVNFYKKGSVTKKKQLDDIIAEMAKVELDEKMAQEQLDVLQNFPPIHPKRGEYEEQLENELEKLREAKQSFAPRHQNLKELYEWSLRIVETVEWLAKQLEAYCNASLNTNLEVEPNSGNVTVEQYLIYKRGLDEITYNLQESQDFFQASLDGRLKRYHQIEKNMIEAQLEVIRKYPPESERRKHVESELLKDLEYVEENMKEDPRVIQHRERMKSMHEDFFALLKWQREKLLRMPFEEPHKIIGDVEKLKKDLEAQLKKTNEKADDGEQKPVADGCPVKHVNVDALSQDAAGSCPVKHDKAEGTSSGCPVKHDKAEAASSDSELRIHRLYEKETPSTKLAF